MTNFSQSKLLSTNQIHYPYTALKQTLTLQRFFGFLISSPFSHNCKPRSESHPLIDRLRLNSAASISCAILALLLLLPVVSACSIDQRQSCGAMFSTSCIGEGHVNYACNGHVVDNGCTGDTLVETSVGVRRRAIAKTGSTSPSRAPAKTSPSRTPVTSPTKTPVTTSPSLLNRGNTTTATDTMSPTTTTPPSVPTTTPSITFPSYTPPPASSSSACLPSGIVCIIMSLLVAIATAPYMLPRA